MFRRSKNRPRVLNPLIRQAVESGEFIPLSQWLRERGISRTTYYRHAADIPSLRDGRRVYVPRAYEMRS